ncbi:MAG: metallophosphoesterase [Nakamurella sp.]
MGSVPTWVWPNAGMLVLVGVYLWWRLVVGTTGRGSTGRHVGTVVAAIVALLGPAALIAQYALPISAQRVLGWPGWLAYGLVIFLLTATLLTEPVRIYWWWRRRRTAASTSSGAGDPETAVVEGQPPSPDRRLFLRRALAAGIGVSAVAVTGIAARSAVGGPAVRTVAITIPGLPATATEMRIALVSDLHLGSISTRAFCQQVVDLVNSEQPDLVLLIGDLTDGTVAQLGDDLRPLADLRAPEGIFFVTGNHEFYFDPDGWLDFIPQLGITVLANEGRTVRGLWLAGVHDIAGRPSGRGPDMDAALTGRADGQPVIMMSHSPNLVHDAVDRNVDLMVSGHTHGGQFYPAALIIGATTPVLTGLKSFGSTQAFVTNGAGFWGPIARLGAPPDITIATLLQPGMSSPD